MKFDFVVVGATGMQGKIVTRDLLENNYSVLMCGRDKSQINKFLKNKKANFEYLDLRDRKRTLEVIKNSGADIVVNCAEGDWNINLLDACMKANVNSIDLGSDIKMTKEQLEKDSVLKKKNLIHITGCGSVPGIGNVMLNYAERKLDKIDDIDVGFAWDSNIKKFVVPFSIQSIIEEFTGLSPIVLNRKFINVNPMETLSFVHHRAIEKEPQFNVGHHPETYTFYEYCKNKGIKNVRFYAGFPKHSFETINKIIELELGSKEEININNIRIKPIESLTETLKKIKIPQGYTETENLWVEIRNKEKTMLMECIVPSLKGWEDAGCNIDTGMPASIIAQMIKNKVINSAGSYTPENIVPYEPFFAELKKRGMQIYENGRQIT